MRELDIVVFPRHVDGERYVGRVVELLDEGAFRQLDHDERTGTIRKDGTTIHWNTVAYRDHESEFHLAYDHPQFGDTERDLGMRVFHRIADRTDRPVEAVEDEFHRKHRYVQYFVRDGLSDFESLFGFLADLQTNEAATVERASQQIATENEDPTSPGRVPVSEIEVDHEFDGEGGHGDDRR